MFAKRSVFYLSNFFIALVKLPPTSLADANFAIKIFGWLKILRVDYKF